jgi:hypothetical protein
MVARGQGGRQSGKDRPTCLVATLDDTAKPRFVIILPITHSPPAEGVMGIEIPLTVKKNLGLDEARSWVIVSEYNIDDWPTAGLAPAPGKRGTFAYGFLPPGLFARIRDAFVTHYSEGRAQAVRR